MVSGTNWVLARAKPVPERWSKYHLFPPPPPPCGTAREGCPALPPAAELFVMVSAGRPVGVPAAAAGAPVEPDCGATTPGAPGAVVCGVAAGACAYAAPDTSSMNGMAVTRVRWRIIDSVPMNAGNAPVSRNVSVLSASTWKVLTAQRGDGRHARVPVAEGWGAGSKCGPPGREGRGGACRSAGRSLSALAAARPRLA